ncbi:hypothetical protein VCUG_01287 [Vavraia culicis subsp. floridensis]|uniref:Uncharacterized protein n=1 Tax=Vavraia culicis (isolate floridensis) TaxID=948595 RepID=L2GUY4_VAVCU|nr:uncharacterized protein VCUG_01287 [Vavraia culicis subsp. floridensis]ELA47187.1 hypothetical protein VCUG_01287 [Vavraia culicis subsp. floridensis]
MSFPTDSTVHLRPALNQCNQMSIFALLCALRCYRCFRCVRSSRVALPFFSPHSSGTTRDRMYEYLPRLQGDAVIDLHQIFSFTLIYGTSSHAEHNSVHSSDRGLFVSVSTAVHTVSTQALFNDGNRSVDVLRGGSAKRAEDENDRIVMADERERAVQRA